MEAATLAAGAAILAGAALQSTTGFGFALVAAPLVFAATDPEPAIWLLIVLSALANGLTLLTEGRRPRPLMPATPAILAWSVPGLFAGVAFLTAVDGDVLQAVVSVVVLASLAMRRRAPHVRWPLPLAGVTMGVLNTATSTGGPPLVLYLLGRDLRPEQVRDTLSAVFMASAFLAAAVLAITATQPLPPWEAVAAGVPLAVAGNLLGRRIFRRLSDHGYEAALILVLVATATGAALRALG